LRDANEKLCAHLYSFKGDPTLELIDANGNLRVGLGVLRETAYVNVLGIDRKSSAEVMVERDGPSLSVSDQKGFSSKVGVADLEDARTGETSKTSAASLMIFGKKGKVVWQAP
jgi:hypothetical protein